VTRSQAVARIADRAASQQTIYKLAIRPIAKLHLQLFSRYCALSVLAHWGHEFELSWSRDVIDHVTI